MGYFLSFRGCTSTSALPSPGYTYELTYFQQICNTIVYMLDGNIITKESTPQRFVLSLVTELLDFAITNSSRKH